MFLLFIIMSAFLKMMKQLTMLCFKAVFFGETAPSLLGTALVKISASALSYVHRMCRGR